MRDPQRMVGRLKPDWDAVKRELRKVLADLANGKADWPLYLWGKTGVGKTCAVIALENMVPRSTYVTAEALADAVYADIDAWPWYAMGDRDRLVVVDEIGLRQDSDQRGYLGLKRAADCREHLPTIWVSNHNEVKLLQLFDDRIVSRLTCGTVVELNDRDRRFG